jgi:hypothetical protein
MMAMVVAVAATPALAAAVGVWPWSSTQGRLVGSRADIGVVAAVAVKRWGARTGASSAGTKRADTESSVLAPVLIVPCKQ